MRTFLLLSLASLASLAARADGDTFLVLPVLATGGVNEQADALTSGLRLALEDRSLRLKPRAEAENAVVVVVACSAARGQACALEAGTLASATQVIAAELWNVGGGYVVHLGIANVTAKTFQQVKVEGADFDTVRAAARAKMLELLLPGSLDAELQLTFANAGAVVIVDGVEVGKTPLLKPLRLAPGNHQLEVRTDTDGAFARALPLKAEEKMVLELCVKEGAVVDCHETAAPAPDGSMKTPLFYGGIVGAGVGLAGVAVGGVLQVVARAGYDELAQEEEVADVTGERIRGLKGMQTGALVSAGVGVAFLAAGAGSAIASTMME